MKDTFTREELIEMLTQMQIETANCVGFFKGTVTQAWVIKDLLGKKIKELGGEGVTVEYV
ncbi:MAG: hypothetical protein K2H01_11490 [Ruminococcus sp.]|nr:hypothetical protein [Ruminococcus sp.]